MDEAEVRATLDDLKRDRARIRPELARLMARDAALDQSISAFVALLTALTGDGPPPSGASEEPFEGLSSPRGAEAVRQILIETGESMTTKEILTALTARGWAPRSTNPENATSTNASRAFDVYEDVRRMKAGGGQFVYYWTENSEGIRWPDRDSEVPETP